MNKKICFIINQFSFGGGCEKVLSNLSMNLSDEYEQTIIVLYNNNDSDREIIEWENKAKNIIYLDFDKPKSNIKKILSTKKIVKEVVKIRKNKKFDSVVGFGYFSNNIAISSKGVGKTSVVIHDNKEVSFFNKLYFAKFKFADQIITVSEGIRKDFIKYFKIKPEKIKCIYNAYNLEDFNQENKLSESPFDDTKFNIINVGRLERQKGQWHAINVMKKLSKKNKNIVLNIFGEGSLKEELIEKVKNDNLEENIVFHGFKKNIYDYMKYANMFLLTSLHEGFSLVIVEAMGCGIPVVSVDCKSGPKELVLKDKEISDDEDFKISNHGIISKGFENVSDKKKSTKYNSKIEMTLANLINDISKDKELLCELIEGSKERVKDFDIKKIIKQWDEVI